MQTFTCNTCLGMFGDIRDVVVHELQSQPHQLVWGGEIGWLQQERRVAYYADDSQSTGVQLRLLPSHEVFQGMTRLDSVGLLICFDSMTDKYYTRLLQIGPTTMRNDDVAECAEWALNITWSHRHHHHHRCHRHRHHHHHLYLLWPPYVIGGGHYIFALWFLFIVYRLFFLA